MVLDDSIEYDHYFNIVYEKKHDVGANWLYDPNVEDDDPLGLNPIRKVHSSIYASLHLISSRETMGFSDYPFLVKEEYVGMVGEGGKLWDDDDDGRKMNGQNMKWLVRCRRKVASLEGVESEELIEQVSDGVVCNGHYTQPRIAQIPGDWAWLF